DTRGRFRLAAYQTKSYACVVGSCRPTMLALDTLSKRIEFKPDAYSIAIAFGAPDLLWHGEEGATILAARDARLPCQAIDGRADWCTAPRMRNGRGILVGDWG